MADQQEWVFENGVGASENDPLLPDLPEAEQEQLNIANIINFNLAQLNQMLIELPNNLQGPVPGGIQVNLPDDQVSSASSESTLLASTDDVFLPLQNGHDESSTHSPETNESSSDALVTQENEPQVEVVHNSPDPQQPKFVDAAEGFDGQEESELSDFTASIEASTEAQANVENLEADNAAEPEQQPQPEPERDEDVDVVHDNNSIESLTEIGVEEVDVCKKLGILISLFSIVMVVIIGLAIEGFISMDFLYISSAFLILLLCLGIGIFIWVCFFSEKDAAQRANRRRQNRARHNDPRNPTARERRYIPFVYRGP